MGESWGSAAGCLPAEPLELNAEVEQWIAAAREELAEWDGSSAVARVFAPPFSAGAVGVALPIVAGTNFFGILCFSSKTTQRRPTPGQVKALHVIASTAGAALESASLLGQLRALNQDLEERVRQRTEDLQAANADLEAFSYSVSHDLRAPLRRVDGYCQMFITEFGGDLSPEGHRILDNARAGAAHMSRLIDDLLRLARYSRQPLQTQPVQMPALVRRVFASAGEQVQGRAVELKIGALPDCIADAALLEQVLTNLISNALKFTAGRASARVEIGAAERAGEQVYFVRDNGVGFDMRHAQRLFGVFQRLHPQSEFEGTGIGLSIVRRIIRRHGGKTWAEGTPGEGATFYFSLPVRAEGVPA
jgi:light-regulated signal transduction histidine kinase (bacteriophytochrome)